MGYLKTNGHNIQQTALVFGITRPLVYDIIRKEGEGNLKDRPRAPHHQPNRTPAWIEDKVIEVKVRTRYGAEMLSRSLKQPEDISIPPGTISHVLRRNKGRFKYLLSGRVRKGKREFIDLYSARPFEIVQVDLKYIRDHKALSREQIIHLDRYDIPNYQWSALDVNSRFKLIAYSREKTWTNGLC
jgi:putative transposase